MLKKINHDLRGVEGCLLTHEHKDHSKSIDYILKAGIDVYASKGTLDFLGIKNRRAKIVDNGCLIRLNGFQVYVFDTNHDAAEPLGCIVRADNEFLLFVTDTSHITQRFKYPFSIIAIECSYDKKILQHRVDTNDIHEEVAKRLLTSHLEKSETLRYLREFCDLSKCREINFLHCSGDNLDKRKTKEEFEKKLFIETKIVGMEANKCSTL